MAIATPTRLFPEHDRQTPVALAGTVVSDPAVEAVVVVDVRRPLIRWRTRTARGEIRRPG